MLRKKTCCGIHISKFWDPLLNTTSSLKIKNHLSSRIPKIIFTKIITRAKRARIQNVAVIFTFTTFCD